MERGGASHQSAPTAAASPGSLNQEYPRNRGLPAHLRQLPKFRAVPEGLRLLRRGKFHDDDPRRRVFALQRLLASAARQKSSLELGEHVRDVRDVVAGMEVVVVDLDLGNHLAFDRCAHDRRRARAAGRKRDLGIQIESGRRLGLELAFSHGIDLGRGRGLGL